MASLTGVGSFITLKQGKSMSSRPQFVPSLSKDAIPGRTYRLFFPKVKTPILDESGNPTGQVEDNFMLSYVVGRDLNYEIFNKVGFMTYKNEWFDMEDINIFKDLTGTDSYAKIMRAAFDASCEKEKAEAERQAKELAAQNGGKVDERALFRKLDNIDIKYHGRPAEDGVQAIYATERPAISGLHGMLITECLRVPMKTDTNTPDWSAATYHYKRCSKQFIQQLIDIVDNPAYNRDDTDYVEISFKYGSDGQKPSEAGRESVYNPVAKELSLEVLYPKDWSDIGKDKVAGIAGGERDAEAAAEAVMKDAGYSNIRITPQELASAVKKWAATNLAVFTHMDMDAQETQRAAKDLISCGILDGLADIKAKVVKMVEELDKDGANGDNSASVDSASKEMAVEETKAAVDPEQEAKTQEAIDHLNTSGSIDGRSAGAYLDIAEDEDDLMGDLV